MPLTQFSSRNGVEPCGNKIKSLLQKAPRQELIQEKSGNGLELSLDLELLVTFLVLKYWWIVSEHRS